MKLISCCTDRLLLRPDSRINCQNWLAKSLSSRQKHEQNTRISLPECANCLANLRRNWSATSENPRTSRYITQIHNPAESTNQKDGNKAFYNSLLRRRKKARNAKTKKSINIRNFLRGGGKLLSVRRKAHLEDHDVLITISPSPPFFFFLLLPLLRPRTLRHGRETNTQKTKRKTRNK